MDQGNANLWLKHIHLTTNRKSKELPSYSIIQKDEEKDTSNQTKNETKIHQQIKNRGSNDDAWSKEKKEIERINNKIH